MKDEELVNIKKKLSVEIESLTVRSIILIMQVGVVGREPRLGWL